MTEFNPNCGKCGMLNSRGFCSLTACRYPSNVIVVEPKVIRGMMVNPQIEKPQTNADRIRAMSDEEIEDWYWWMHKEMMQYTDSRIFVHDWLKSPADKKGEG